MIIIKVNEIKAARVRLGIGQRAMADALGINYHTFVDKEREGRFTIPECAGIAKICGFNFEQVNDILFDGAFDFLIKG